MSDLKITRKHGFLSNWVRRKVGSRLEQKLAKRLTVAGNKIVIKLRHLIGQPGTVLRTYGLVSKPGDPPAKQTGALQRSVSKEQDVLNLEYGYEEKYGYWLEHGTTNADGSQRMAPRPALERAFRENEDWLIDQIISIFDDEYR